MIASSAGKDVWLCYERHANTDALSWPAPATIQKEIGHKLPGHIRRARNRLKELGLLKQVQTGGGTDAAMYQVLMPPVPVADPAPSPDPPCAESAQAPSAESVPQPAPIQPSINKDEDGNTRRDRARGDEAKPIPRPNPSPSAEGAQVTVLAKSGGLEPSLSPEMRWLLAELIDVGGLQLAQYALQSAVAKKGPGVPAAKYAIGIARGRMADQMRAGVRINHFIPDPAPLAQRPVSRIYAS